MAMVVMCARSRNEEDRKYFVVIFVVLSTKVVCTFEKRRGS